MTTKRRLTIAGVTAGFAVLMTLSIIHLRSVKAQDQQPPPNPDRISFGMLGIIRGQTIRLNVVNAIPYDSAYPPGPTRVVLAFLDTEGRLLRNRDGSPVRRAAQLERGQSTMLDLDFDQYPPGPSRLTLRAVVNVEPPPIGEQPPPVSDRILSSVEVINNANSRTVLFIGNPGVIRGFNPQPDPPLGQ
jgi:hypothetical protein